MKNKEKFPYYNTNITKQTLNEMFDEIFRNSKRVTKERDFTMWSGCKTQGMVKLSSKDNFLSLCEDPDCQTCNSIKKAFKQELHGGV
jgi:hypothetical protein